MILEYLSTITYIVTLGETNYISRMDQRQNLKNNSKNHINDYQKGQIQALHEQGLSYSLSYSKEAVH